MGVILLTYDELLTAANEKGIIVTEKSLSGNDGRIMENATIWKALKYKAFRYFLPCRMLTILIFNFCHHYKALHTSW